MPTSTARRTRSSSQSIKSSAKARLPSTRLDEVGAVARSHRGYLAQLGTFSRGGGLVFVTVTEGRVALEREDDLRAAWEETASAPAGLIQSTLVRGEDGTWRIITFWESRDAVMAMRASGEPPALTMFHRAGSQPSVSMGTVERQARE
jgi:heme-degrading monooxygenase HmoA